MFESLLKTMAASVAIVVAMGLGAVDYAAADCGGCRTCSSRPAAASTIPDVAKAAGQFQTLLAAVEAAGLAETLAGEGPFTVFAPTDEAFAKLPEGTVESLLKHENREQLQAILKYHVVAGDVRAADVVELEAAKTVHGGSLTIATSESEGVRVNQAKVLKTDILASNGVIHVIDAVMIPAG